MTEVSPRHTNADLVTNNASHGSAPPWTVTGTAAWDGHLRKGLGEWRCANTANGRIDRTGVAIGATKPNSLDEAPVTALVHHNRAAFFSLRNPNDRRAAQTFIRSSTRLAASAIAHPVDGEAAAGQEE